MRRWQIQWAILELSFLVLKYLKFMLCCNKSIRNRARVFFSVIVHFNWIRLCRCWRFCSLSGTRPHSPETGSRDEFKVQLVVCGGGGGNKQASLVLLVRSFFFFIGYNNSWQHIHITKPLYKYKKKVWCEKKTIKIIP